ncbi:MAG: hypothetical protein F4X11_24860 [Acidobacteria bacterium]|nr:hypothetical protein [Acidobacteriota bacterium]
MPILDIFSKRQMKLRGDVPDVYSYDVLPEPLKVQIVHIVLGALGNPQEYYSSVQYEDSQVRATYKAIVDILCREYGVFRLPEEHHDHGERMYLQELVNFFLQEKNVERSLDVVELCFRVIDQGTRDWRYMRRSNASGVADDALREINERFQEHGVGYCFQNGRIVRIDSQLIHSEVVKPALTLLSGKHYAGAQQEFLNAHEHYRAGKAKEALNECLKAFESTMKTVCDRQGWTYEQNATAKKLLDICFDNGLVPAFWKQHFSALRSLLESSVPTGRNRLSGHGQGSVPTSVPAFLVGYVLHMTAAAIVFMGKAEQSGAKK